MLKKIRIALYDREGYMCSLVDYLCRKSQSIIETRLFTSLEMLWESADTGGIDVLLAGEEVSGEIVGLQEKIPQIMLLSDGSQVSEESEYHLVFKYQSAQSIVREILEKVAEDDRICYSQRITVNRSLELIGVYAPFGGAGVTRYALAAAQGLAKHHKTLYVNMELFQGLDILPVKKKGKEGVSCRGMSEVIFYLKQRKDKLALKLETLVVSLDGLDYILAVEDYRDLYSINCDDINLLIKVLSQQSEYDKVLFDIGYIGDSALHLMGQCNRLYMPEPITKTQKLKEQAFCRFLARGNYEQVLQKIKKVEMTG